MGIRMYREHVHHQLFLETIYEQLDTWAIDNTDSYRAQLFGTIERSSYYYNEENKTYRDQLDSLFLTGNAIHEQLEKLRGYIGVRPGDQPYQYTREINPAEWDTLKYSMKRYHDTLCVRFQNNPQLIQTLHPLLIPTPEDRFWTLADAARPDETGILLRLLNGRVIQACIKGMYHLGARFSVREWGFPVYYPIMLEPGKTIHPGDVFEADFTLAEITEKARNLEIRLNGKPLPYECGRAHYRTSFDTAGKKRLKVEILVKNGFNQSVDTFSKDFWVRVLDGDGGQE